MFRVIIEQGWAEHVITEIPKINHPSTVEFNKTLELSRLGGLAFDLHNSQIMGHHDKVMQSRQRGIVDLSEGGPSIVTTTDILLNAAVEQRQLDDPVIAHLLLRKTSNELHRTAEPWFIALLGVKIEEI